MVVRNQSVNPKIKAANAISKRETVLTVRRRYIPDKQRIQFITLFTTLKEDPYFVKTLMDAFPRNKKRSEGVIIPNPKNMREIMALEVWREITTARNGIVLSNAFLKERGREREKKGV